MSSLAEKASGEGFYLAFKAALSEIYGVDEVGKEEVDKHLELAMRLFENEREYEYCAAASNPALMQKLMKDFGVDSADVK